MNFDFYLGGYGRDNSYQLILERNELRISIYQGIPLPEHDKVISVENNKDWEQLVKFLESCKWNRRYDSDILDGTQWELKAKGKGINMKSYGSNAYPAGFNEFLVLLNRVVKEVGVEIAK